MNKKLLPSLLVLFTLLIQLSCRKDDDGNVKINIDEEFKVFLYEELFPGENRLNLHIQTLEALECSNYELGHSTVLEDNTITVSIDELSLEGDCDNIEALAQANAKFGILTDGLYDLEINLRLNSIINKGKLKVGNDTYQITMETSHGFSTSSEILHSIPDGYCWGFFELIDASAIDIRNDFFTAMADFTKAANLPNGHYGHFDVVNNNLTINTWSPYPSIPSGATSFLYRIEGEVSELVAYIQSFQAAQQGRAKVVLFTAEGLVIGL